MSDHVELVLELKPEERQRIIDLAHERGYSQAQDYLLALVESDVIGAAIVEDEDDMNAVEKAQLMADFREAWHDAMTGNTLPASALWDELDKDGE